MMTGLSAFARKLFTRLLGMLPDRTKRLLLVASVAGAAKDKADLGSDTLSRLNELMLLCSSEKAMEFPIALGKVIWDEKVVHDLSEAVEHNEDNPVIVAAAVERLKEQIPGWLLYDKERVDSDLQTLVQHKFGSQ